MNFTPELHFTMVEPIMSGWSADKKFLVENSDGTRYFLRISSIEQYESKKATFEFMKQVAMLNVPMCEPIKFGTCSEGCFLLQSWIDGVDMKAEISCFSEQKQYAYGWEAGNILRKIHSIPASADQEKWADRFNRKIDAKISGYNDCSQKFDGAELMIRYINAHRHLLENRSQCHQHGDYHIGNMMLDHSGKLIIIDFDRNDLGDPWEEFNRIVWCAQQSPAFASGMVDGYFEASPSRYFWDLLALYIANNTLSSIPWAIPWGVEEVRGMMNQAAEILRWYKNMQTTIPQWYRDCRVKLNLH